MNEPFNPAILTSARNSRARTEADVAKATGVSQGLISKIENAVRVPSQDDVTKIANYLDYPWTLFYEAGPVDTGRSPCPYHRKRKTLPATILNTLNGRMSVRLINIRHLLQGLEVEGDRTFHTLDPEEFGSPERVAQALRTAWGVPHGPIRELVALIESAGGVITSSSFGTSKLFGMSQWTTKDHPLFFLNADTPMEELRWTIAHELGHLTMHGFPTASDLEAEADAFAGEFLAPRSLIFSDLKKLTFGRLPALKMHWGISMKALIKRAEVLGAIDRTAATRLYKQYSARQWHNAEPYPIPHESPSLIREAARVHFEDHRYSVTELADAVRLSEDELRRELLEVHGATPPLSIVRD